jgi:hypothetical protein
MAFTPNNQPMNPFTGSPPSMSRAPVPMAPSPGVNPAGGVMPPGRSPVRRRKKAKPQGMPGYQRRKGSRPTGPGGPPSMPRTPEAAPLPKSSLPSPSSPLTASWASSRSLGNGGYA